MDPNGDYAALFPANDTRYNFRPYLLSDVEDRSAKKATFDSIRNEFGHDRIDFLKVDIEHGEFKIFPQILQDGKGPKIPICHIFVEVHTVGGRKFAGLLKLFEKAGYYMYAREVLFCGSPCSEYSFIHDSCLADYGLEKQTKPLYKNWNE